LQPTIRGPQQETGGPFDHGPSGFVSTARGRQLFAFFSRNFVASPTVKIVSAASSGISQPNSSSNAITSSTVSRLSAPRSSMKLALSTTFSGSTPRCSTTIFLTRSPISLIVQPRCSLDPTPRRYEPSWSSTYSIAHSLDSARSVPTKSPANGRRRHANIQGFNILQGVPLPIHKGFGYHTSQALTTSLKRPAKPPLRRIARASKGLKTWPFRHLRE